MGPVEDSAAVVYLRPETAQGIYVNFLNVQQSTRQKVPFGIAQIGKAFRNEITPGNFIFRTREFEQMEMQFFVEPGRPTCSGSSTGRRSAWSGTGRWGSIDGAAAVPPAHAGGARALRARGVRHPVRLRRHARLPGDRGRAQPRRLRPERGTRSISGKKLEYFDQPNNRRFMPYVDRDVGGRRPHDAGGARERVPRGDGGGRGRRGVRCSASTRRWRRSRPASSRS